MGLRPHSRLGPYEIIGLLGVGGMGEVYRARDTRLGRDVAVKVLPDHAMQAPTGRRRFEQEARAASALNHPNICAIFDISEHEGTPYIVMELLDGESLGQRMRAGPMPAVEVLRLAGQIADVLATAHGAGIVHRDLSPGNIFVTSRGDVKILDFGLAKLTTSESFPSDEDAKSTVVPLTTPGYALGTPGYASPEATLGVAVDARSDLFSFGALLYEMASGHRAFPGNTPALRSDAVVHATPQPLARVNSLVPPGLSEIVDKALEKDPALRYQSAAEIQADLKRLARNSGAATPAPLWLPPAGGATPHSGPSAPAPAQMTPQGPGSASAHDAPPRRRRLAWLAAALVLTAVAAMLWQFGPRWFAARSSLPEWTGTDLTSGAGAAIDPAISPDGHTIAYVVDDGTQQSIWLAETRGGQPTPWTKKPGRYGHPTWARDRRIFFESGEADARGIYMAPEFDSERANLVVPGGREPAVSPDGARLAFAKPGPSGYQRIHVAPVENLNDIKVLTRDGDGRENHISPAWSPDGTRICYGHTDGLSIVAASPGQPGVPLTRGTGDSHPAWARSGFIYFSSYRDGQWQVWRIRPGGKAPEPVTRAVETERMPAISPDGSVLAFSKAENRSSIRLRDVATSAERPIEGEGIKAFPSFAFKGEGLVFVLRAWGQIRLYVQPLADGAPTGSMLPLIPQVGPQAPPRTHTQPAASPDGRWIAFVGNEGASRDIYVVPATGGLPVNVTSHEAQDYQPAWSPDSSQVAFVSERDGGQRVWIQRVQDGRPTGNPVRLTRGTPWPFEQWPAWSPDGRSVAVITEGNGVTDVGVVDLGDARTPSLLTRGSSALHARWSDARGWLFVCGTFGSGRATIRAFDPVRRVYVPEFPAVDQGTDAVMGCVFDVSPDGRTLALTRMQNSGGISLLVAKSGSF